MKINRKAMTKTAGKLIAVLLVFSVMAVFFALTSFAETSGSFSFSTVEPEKGEDFESYNKITRYSRDDTETELAVDIPDVIDKVPTEVIAANAFRGNDIVEEFVIPNTVKTIENSAFADCTALKIVIIPDSVTDIGYSAFQGCTALEYVIIGDGVETVRSLAFKDCSALKYLRLGSAVKDIGSGAFYNCTSLKDIVVPASVNKIGSMALGYYDQGDTCQAVDGVRFCVRAGNDALDNYIMESYSGSQSGISLPMAEIIGECADGAHTAVYTLMRTASEDHTGVELGECQKCLAVLKQDNNEIPPKEQSSSGITSLIIVIIAVIAFAALVFFYVRRSRARRAKAIEEYRKKEEGSIQQ
ncbi:MAG: leucine-rich repeat domain-containing protein [Clostridia bacterium]|nr:leucine-rich repeat domain-containing protein [Clostridia bacterium]